MIGWTASYRKIWNHPLFKGSAERVGAWTWMIHTACWKDTDYPTGDTSIHLKRGQLCVSQRQIEIATGMGRQKVRTFLDALEREGAITRKTVKILTHKPTQKLTKDPTHAPFNTRTIVTICKYDDYQSGDGSEKNKPTQKPTQDLTISQPNNKQYKQNNNLPPSEEAVASEPVQVSVLTTAMWNATKQYLGSQGVPNPGAMIGRWLKSHGPMEIITAADQAQRAGTQDPVPYITRILSNKDTGKPDLDALFASLKTGESR